MRDLLVAGGGPVGLVTALHAVRAGLGVTVWEPRAGIVDKACGEGLMPGAVADLTSLGVILEGHRLAGIRYVDGAHVAQARFRQGTGMGVRRTVLHAALLEAVCSAGVRIEERRVSAVRQGGDHVVADGEPFGALVAADGLHSTVRRLVGLDSPGHADPHRRHGLRRHVAIAPWTPFVEVHWAVHGEAYVTPVGPDQVGVAVLTTQRRSFDDLLAGFPTLERRLRGLPTTSTVRGAGPLRQTVRRRVAGRVLLVGDAAGYVDALTGEGIALGLAQARAAVASIIDGVPQRYETRSRHLVRRHELLTKGLVVATRSPLVRRHLVATAARVPAVFGFAVDQLARPA